jgi:hypothetical protein
MFSRLLSLLGAFVLLPLASMARAQDAQHAFAHGMVVDSHKAPLAEAEVLVLDSANKVVGTGRTDNTGEFTLGGLIPKTAYLFSVRKIGFTAGAAKMVTPQAGDTLWVDVMLQGATPQLNAVNVTANANAAYHIDSTEIAKQAVENGLDVVLKYRPRMLGDAYKECRPDTSHLGPPVPPTPLAPLPGRPGIRVPASIQSLTFFDTSLAAHGYPPPPRLSNPADTLGKSPPLLYVNGVLHSEWGMKNILADIPAEDIAEMRYIDCWDTAYPLQMRNALFIVLKPGKAY